MSPGDPVGVVVALGVKFPGTVAAEPGLESCSLSDGTVSSCVSSRSGLRARLRAHGPTTDRPALGRADELTPRTCGSAPQRVPFRDKRSGWGARREVFLQVKGQCPAARIDGTRWQPWASCGLFCVDGSEVQGGGASR